MVGSRSTDVRDQVLAAATRQFAVAGFDGTSLQAIADEVGVRKQSLLHYFPSKDELRAAVHQKMLDHWSDALPRLLRAATSGEGQFDAVVQELVRFFVTDADRARLILREVLDRPDEVRAMVRAQVTPWVAIVSDYIRKGQAAGRIWPEVDPEAFVVQVMTQVISAIAVHACIRDVLPAGASPSREPAASLSRSIAELVRMAKASLFVPIAPRPDRTRRRARTRDARTFAAPPR